MVYTVAAPGLVAECLVFVLRLLTLLFLILSIIILSLMGFAVAMIIYEHIHVMMFHDGFMFLSICVSLAGFGAGSYASSKICASLAWKRKLKSQDTYSKLLRYWCSCVFIIVHRHFGAHEIHVFP